ncbi:Glucanosyltransferase-domain-containing protein [Aspergillus californicus]
MFARGLSLGWLFVAVISVLGDTDPIVIKGSKFFHSSNGTQFYVKGIHYAAYDQGTSSLSEVDLLATESACERDIPVLQELGVNTIGLLHADGGANHDQCMGLLRDAGIYVMPFLKQLNTDPIYSERPSWTTDQFSQMTAIVDSFAAHDNVIAFMFQTEAAANSTDDAYSKAIVRDMKAYIASQSYRAIPVGFAAEISTLLGDETDYFNCDSEDESADLFGVQSYGWCGNSTLAASGWDVLSDSFDEYSMPVIMSEYGCVITPEERYLTEVSALYGSDMTDIWSGGLLYTYSGGSTGNYGLVNVSNQEVTKGDAFTTFSSRLAAVTPTSIDSDSYTPTNTEMRACPTVDSTWRASSDLPPQPDSQYCECRFGHSLCQVVDDYTDDDDVVVFTERVICDDIPEVCNARSNPATGNYELYSMCNVRIVAAILASNYTEEERGSSASACTQIFTSQIITANPTYTPTGTCTTQPIYEGSLETTESDSSSDSSSESDNNDTSGDSGLGAGAIAGIVVGAVVGIAIIALGLFWLRRRKRYSAVENSTIEAAELPDKHQEKAELPTEGSEVAELHTEGSAVAELQGEMPPELYGSNVSAAELPGSERRSSH